MALSDAQAVCLAEKRPDVVRHFVSYGRPASSPSQIKAIFTEWWGYARGPSAALPQGDESYTYHTLDEYAAQKCGGGSGSVQQPSAGGQQPSGGATGVIAGSTSGLLGWLRKQWDEDPAPLAIAGVIAGYYLFLRRR